MYISKIEIKLLFYSYLYIIAIKLKIIRKYL